jgi:hypothetical protein
VEKQPSCVSFQQKLRAVMIFIYGIFNKAPDGVETTSREWRTVGKIKKKETGEKVVPYFRFLAFTFPHIARLRQKCHNSRIWHF